MSGISAVVASIAMFAAIALGWGGTWLILKRRDPKHGILMIVAGLVLFGNVLIWVWPAEFPGEGRGPAPSRNAHGRAPALPRGSLPGSGPRPSPGNSSFPASGALTALG